MGLLRGLAPVFGLAALLTGAADAVQRPTRAAAAARSIQAVQMPNLVGRPLGEAARLLALGKLQLRRVDSLVSTRPTGTVVRQSIPANRTVAAGTLVDLVVAVSHRRHRDDVRPQDDVGTRDGPPSGEVHTGNDIRPQDDVRPSDDAGPSDDVGPPRVDSATVPDLFGSNRLSSGIVLALAKLQVGRTDSVRDDRNDGKVVRQSPQPGTRVPRGSPVHLIFGYAPRVVVPDLRDSTLAGAARVLEEAGLALGAVERIPTDGDAGRVIRQDPRPRRRVVPGTEVRVTAGILRVVAVPPVVDSLLRAAVQTLRQVGLAEGPVNQIESDAEPQTVLAQNPPAGTTVQPGSRVALDVAIPRRLVTVPGVIGSRPTEAIETIRSSRLSIATVDSVLRAGAPGLIDSQDPRGGARVPPGTAVALRVVAPLPTVAVPHVVDSTLAGATQVLTRDGFQLQPVQYVTRVGGRRTVVAQVPTAGSAVPRGAPVRLTIALPPKPPPPPPPPPAGTTTGDTLETGDVSTRVDSFPPAKPLLVPDVVGRTVAIAESLLGRASLRIERIEIDARRTDAGSVLRQEPLGGTVTAPDALVRVWVGVWPPVWLVAMTGGLLLGGGAATTPAAVRRLRDWRRKKRLGYRPCYDRGRQTIVEGNESLGNTDLQLAARPDPGGQVTVVEDPAFNAEGGTP